jgi:GNAT superfamily N-acetyltransferase
MSNDSVRLATLGDMEAIIEIADQFNNEVDWPFEHKTNKEHMRNTYPGIVQSDAFVFFLTEDNMAGTGVAMAPDLCTGKLQAQELFWWVHPDLRGQKHGINLYNALEVYCKASGVEILAMITLESLRPKVVGRVYKNQGYSLIEHGYMKKIGA